MGATTTLLALDNGAMWIKGATIAGIIVASYVAVLWVAMIIWVYRDISARTVNRWLRAACVLLVAAGNLPGALVYMVLRPGEPLVETYSRQLEMEAFRKEAHTEACRSCRRPVEAEYAFCPYCTTELRSPCAACSRLLHESWTLCPYCSAPRGAEVAAASRRPAAVAKAPAVREAQPIWATASDSSADGASQPAASIAGG